MHINIKCTFRNVKHHITMRTISVNNRSFKGEQDCQTYLTQLTSKGLVVYSITMLKTILEIVTIIPNYQSTSMCGLPALSQLTPVHVLRAALHSNLNFLQLQLLVVNPFCTCTGQPSSGNRGLGAYLWSKVLKQHLHFSIPNL
jgi:hypothetical protein